MEWPKCEYRLEYPKEKCVNGRRWRWCKLPVPYGSDLPDKYEWQDRGPCPKCNGTGERELTADEADKYLRFNKCRWWPLYECPDDVIIEVELYKFTGTVSHERLGNYAGYNLTEALRAAARAVYRRQG